MINSNLTPFCIPRPELKFNMLT